LKTEVIIDYSILHLNISRGNLKNNNHRS